MTSYLLSCYSLQKFCTATLPKYKGTSFKGWKSPKLGVSEHTGRDFWALWSVSVQKDTQLWTHWETLCAILVMKWLMYIRWESLDRSWCQRRTKVVSSYQDSNRVSFSHSKGARICSENVTCSECWKPFGDLHCWKPANPVWWTADTVVRVTGPTEASLTCQCFHRTRPRLCPLIVFNSRAWSGTLWPFEVVTTCVLFTQIRLSSFLSMITLWSPS